MQKDPTGTTKSSNVAITRHNNQVTVDGSPVSLHPKEYYLVARLMTAPADVVSYADLTKAVFRSSELVSTRTIDAIADRARTALSIAGAHPGHLATVEHHGIRFYQPPV